MVERGEIVLGGCIVDGDAPALRCPDCGMSHGTNEWLQDMKRREPSAEEHAKWQADQAARKKAKADRRSILKARVRASKKP